MSSAQLLLRRLLEQAGGPEETGFLLVIDSEGLENLPLRLGTTKGEYGVHRVSTELGLRHLLWRAKGAPLIAVMPEALAHHIQRSPDLLRRARNQRVHGLSVNDVLEVVLGVRVVGAEAPYMQQLAMEYVDQIGMAMSQRTLPTVVDRRLLTELLVDVSVGEQVRTRRPADLLASWVLEPPQWSLKVNQLVREAMPTLHGDEGRLLAWALADPERRLRELVVHGALLTVEAPELPKPAWGPLWRALTEAPLQMDERNRPILRRILSRLAEDTLTALGDKAGPLLDEADKLGRETLTPTELQTSRVLPLAFADRCHALAQQAASGRPISAADMTWLSAHQAASMKSADLAVLEALARLSRALNQPYSPQGGLVDQVRAYQRDGAFADLALIQLRRALASSTHYHGEANKLMSTVRERRDKQNRAFAQALAAGYEAALHSEGLTPLHRIWKRTVAPLWQRQPDARLYLLVLDGCSYPVFLELLAALSQDSAFPLGLRPDADGYAAGLPALSPLPTVTSHARGALFLGELPQDPLVAETVFHDQEEAKTDKARFNQNAALGGRRRRLFLKADLADGGQALLEALSDDTVAAVATVFTAVDDLISSSSTGSMVRLAPENIAGLKPSLRRAIESGRHVLITSDHGHSPYVDKSLRAGAGKTHRFQVLGQSELPDDSFLEIDLGALGGPPERRAFAWRSGTYLGNPQVGFHGGCSLEEMVVPLAWLERDGLHANEPAWWFGRGALPEPLPVHRTPEPAPPPPPQAKASKQLSLFNPADKADILLLPQSALAKLDQDQRAALVLLKENGSARVSELAERLNKPPDRLKGLMVNLRRALHAEGLLLFTIEVLPNGEALYRYKDPEEG